MTLRLLRLDDGRQFSHQVRGPWRLWDWITAAVSAEFECHPDDVHAIELEPDEILEDKPSEIYTADGKAVAYMVED